MESVFTSAIILTPFDSAGIFSVDKETVINRAVGAPSARRGPSIHHPLADLSICVNDKVNLRQRGYAVTGLCVNTVFFGVHPLEERAVGPIVRRGSRGITMSGLLTINPVMEVEASEKKTEEDAESESAQRRRGRPNVRRWMQRRCPRSGDTIVEVGQGVALRDAAAAGPADGNPLSLGWRLCAWRVLWAARQAAIREGKPCLKM